MTVNLSNVSIVSWFEDVEKNRCGYCKCENSSISNGMWAEQLTVEDYQNLIDRGWRRSGKYCYKPNMNKTCCPQYTIRCEALNISLRKSQKRIIKNVNRFLEDGILNKKDFHDGYDSHYQDNQEQLFQRPNLHIKVSEVQLQQSANEVLKENFVRDGAGEPCHTQSVDISKDLTRAESLQINNQVSNSPSKVYKDGMGPDSSKPPCKKAKLVRLERKMEKLHQKGLKLDIEKKKPEVKSLEDFINGIRENSKCKLKIVLVSCSKFEDNALEEEYELYKKYQMIIHQDPPEKLSLNRFKRFLVTSPLKITVERMTTSSDNFQVCAQLFAKYQIHIHNEPANECGETDYSRFLVDTPLEFKEFPSKDGPGFGSFHQQYWLDDKLIAVGVIDILPRCISSVYFFYDPDYTSLTLGTYSSLREVYFTRSLQKHVPEMCFYYMGFYIHSCPKMRYKGKLSPSYLLCPETYSWIPIEKAIGYLDAHKYSRLNFDACAVDNNVPKEDDFSQTKIVYDNQFMTLPSYRRISTRSNALFNQIGLLVGNRCLRNMVFWIQ